MRNDRYKHGLFESCQAVHMHITGASDPLPDFEQRVLWLQSRQHTWTPGLGFTESYDRAARVLLDATMAEVERRGVMPEERPPVPQAVDASYEELVARTADAEKRLTLARVAFRNCRQYCQPSCPACGEEIERVLREP